MSFMLSNAGLRADQSRRWNDIQMVSLAAASAGAKALDEILRGEQASENHLGATSA
jgi:hypothetical protein